MKNLIDHDLYPPHDNGIGQLSEAADADVRWNKLVSVALMLYHWRLACSYETILPLLGTFRRWHGQRPYQRDNTLIDQVLAQWPVQDDRPRIWACYHIGPYGLLTRALLQRGHRVAVLLKDEVYEEQYPVYRQVYTQCFGREPKETELRFIRSGTPACILQLKQAIQDGMHVLCYIDGDEGGDSTKGTVQVEIQGIPLLVRYGIAVLAQWTKTPIRPVLLYDDGLRLRLDSDADYAVYDQRDHRKTMQKLYALPARLDGPAMMQWEVLPNLPARVLWADRPQTTLAPLWLPIQGDSRLLFDLSTLSVIAVGQREYEKIWEGTQALLYTGALEPVQNSSNNFFML